MYQEILPAPKKPMSIIDRFNRIPTRITVSLLLLVGIAERSLWNLIRPGIGAPKYEAFNVAAALANGFGFADTFRAGQGPTAHLLPISPAIAGSLYAVFGIQAWPAEFLLA